MSVRVMTQNAMCWEEKGVGEFSQRAPLIKRAILNNNVDVVGFQEVTPFWTECFQRDLEGFDNITVYRAESNKEGTPIYWNSEKLTALDKGHFWLSDTPDTESLGWDAKCYRIACWVLFEEKETGKKFAFINTHLDHRGEKARINGIQLVCDFIKEKFGSDMPLVLTGDFNARPDSDTLCKARSLLNDARDVAKVTTDEPTFHGFKGLESIIDYIFISNNIKCNEFKVVKEKEGESFQSDHNGIVAEIEV